MEKKIIAIWCEEVQQFARLPRGKGSQYICQPDRVTQAMMNVSDTAENQARAALSSCVYKASKEVLRILQKQ